MVKEALAKDDLFQAVNGEWLKEAIIPNDQPTTGGFMDLVVNVEQTLMADLDEMLAGNIPLETAEQEELVAYYRLAQDTKERDRLGIEPLLGELAKVQAIENMADLKALLAAWAQKSYPGLLNFTVSPRLDDVLNNALWLRPARTILPDTTSYEDEKSREPLLTIFANMVKGLCQAVPELEERAEKIAQNVLAFDRRLVPHLLSNEELADYTKHYHHYSRESLAQASEHLSLTDLVDEVVEGKVDEVIVTQPKFMEALNTLVTPGHLAEIKDWLIGRLLVSEAPFLSESLRQTGSQFQMALMGLPEPLKAERQIYYLAKEPFDQVLGQYYAKKYFGAEANANINALVQEILATFKKRLAQNTWLSKATIEKAQKKLATMRTFVGYPEKLPADYALRTVDRALGFYGNTLRLRQIINRYEFDQWNQAADRERWEMSADTVNAYFSPEGNLICFPAAILQAPFYDLKQSRSENLGGIGAVMAHEITHAFDNNGAKFDELGNLNNWWEEADYEAFEVLTKRMIHRWDGYPYAGGQVNGTLTVSENIADEGGLAGALAALKQDEDADLKAFFYNFARIWRFKARPDYEALLLKVDVHSPSPLRANLTPQNLDEFHDTFKTESGDGMWLAPADRVKIW